MRWGIYSTPDFEGAHAWREGLLKIGCSGNLRSAWDFTSGQAEGFDAVALFGLHGRGRQIKAEAEEHGVPVVLIDYGYIKRTNAAHDWRTGHWQVSLGELNALPQSAIPGRFDALGVDIKDRGGAPSGYTLLCLQLAGDASHGLSDDELSAWAHEQSAKWPRTLVRPHPLAPEVDFGLMRCGAQTLADALAGARVVVTGNSNTGHDALLAGVPAVATFPGAAWGDLSGEQIPSLQDRRAYFERVASGQWTWAEFKTGEPQRRITEQLKAHHDARKANPL